ncbi:hypothetical protein [Streptomyces avermitilis]|uniref:hypothetical protein n=1 Tax=Streptomyces avermitilis TaxID=33903 RepID=UPI0033D3F316
MLDYRTHSVALDAFIGHLAELDDPQTADLRDEHVRDASRARGMAVLGSLVDHLLRHANSDGAELDIIERAAALWQKGITLYSTLGEFRQRLEEAVNDPSSVDALRALNAATAALQPLAVDVLNQLDSVDQLRADVSAFPHLPPHPRQDDLRTDDWDWGNYFLARRTDAFTRAVRQLAHDQSTSAFALGVLSSYGANACGSAYLGRVVGGPRRGHRRRDRLASYAVGTWFAERGATSLPKTLEQLKAEAPEELPKPIADLIRQAIDHTYDRGKRPDLPDLPLGYRRLLRHLELISGFALPPQPSVPIDPFLTRLHGDPAHPFVPAMPPSTGLTEAGVPGGSGGSSGGVVPQNHGTDDGPSHAEDPNSTEVKCGAFWEALGESLVFLLGGWFACAVKWANGDRCPLWDDLVHNWERAFPGGIAGAVEITGSEHSPLTSDDLSNLAKSDQVVHLIGDLFHLQVQSWEALNKAVDYLAVFGLIYPDGLLGQWRYGQHLRTRETGDGVWPQLPETSQGWHEYPETGTEEPANNDRLYPDHAAPDVFITGAGELAVLTAPALSAEIWRQMAIGELEANNLDLDADRGAAHPCWATGGSINDQPLAVDVLDYDQG